VTPVYDYLVYSLVCLQKLTVCLYVIYLIYLIYLIFLIFRIDISHISHISHILCVIQKFLCVILKCAVSSNAIDVCKSESDFASHPPPFRDYESNQYRHLSFKLYIDKIQVSG
jgi:hypothetical protein